MEVIRLAVFFWQLGDSLAGSGPHKVGWRPSGSMCAEGFSSSLFSKALYVGVLQAMELKGPIQGLADGLWVLTGAVCFSETLKTYGPTPTF